MKKITRRNLLKTSVISGSILAVSNFIPTFALAGKNPPPIEHPLKKPLTFVVKGRCPNCGMMLGMWARTRHEFNNSEGTHATCSIRCVADMSHNSDELPANTKVALYLHPETMVAADTVFYVIGSSAKGTMTMKSKLAFATKNDAETFAAQYGGKTVAFQAALTAATKELAVSRPKIEQKRKKKGKIAEPDAQSRCTVCGMYPARYPEHRCQLSTANGEIHHFCSTQCLINFTTDQAQYVKKAVKIQSIWVTVYKESTYEYGTGLYYLAGSDIMGPMGKEALAYRNKKQAEETAAKHGGTVLRLQELTPALIQNHP